VIKRGTYIVLLAALNAMNLFSQDYHFSQFMQTTAFVNPAYAAFPATGEVGLVYRNQWPGIPATFVTYGADFLIPVQAVHSGVGVSFMNDVQAGGVISRTSATLLYGYMFNVGRSWQMGTGINASWIYKKFNADQLVFRSDILNDLGYSYGPVTMPSYNKGYPDFSIGLIARNKKNLSFGISAGHVTRPDDSFGGPDVSRLPVKYAAFVQGRIGNDQQMGSSLVLEPAAFISLQKQSNELVWGTQVLLGENFQVGGWLRQNLAFRYEAFIVSAGISFEHYNISYSYDVNLKKIQFVSTKMAAHEVTFLYRFEYKDKKIKKNECPAYL
jgi:type IX secretion system PorP/SprF family membrane protein